MTYYLQTALTLTLGRMLEAAVLDGALQLRLEEEVLEPGGVDANIAPTTPSISNPGRKTLTILTLACQLLRPSRRFRLVRHPRSPKVHLPSGVRTNKVFRQ